MMGTQGKGAQQTLSAVGLSKQLGRRTILDKVSLQGVAGETVVLRGENGAGKSTLLRILAGILEPDAGQVTLCGEVLGCGGVAARRHLGYVPDSTEQLPELLVAEFINLNRALKSAPPPAPALVEQLGVTPILLQRLSTLSFGQRKRCCLVAALLGDPFLLLLDEPSNGLDPDGVQLLLTLLAERSARGLLTVCSTNDDRFAAALAGTEYRLAAGVLQRLTALDMRTLTAEKEAPSA